MAEYNSIQEYFNINIEENPIKQWVTTHFQNNSLGEKITCSKLAKLYSNTTGNKIGKTKMFYILKNKSNLRFLKTCIKTSKIISPNSIFSCFYFIKIIARAILLGFNIYFMYESSILTKNNHYKC